MEKKLKKLIKNLEEQAKYKKQQMEKYDANHALYHFHKGELLQINLCIDELKILLNIEP